MKFNDLLEPGADYMQWQLFTPAKSCNINKGVLHENCGQKPINTSIYVGDCLLCVASTHFRWLIQAFIESIFIVTARSATVLTHCTLTLDKWEGMKSQFNLVLYNAMLLETINCIDLDISETHKLCRHIKSSWTVNAWSESWRNYSQKKSTSERRQHSSKCKQWITSEWIVIRITYESHCHFKPWVGISCCRICSKKDKNRYTLIPLW